MNVPPQSLPAHCERPQSLECRQTRSASLGVARTAAPGSHDSHMMTSNAHDMYIATLNLHTLRTWGVSAGFYSSDGVPSFPGLTLVLRLTAIGLRTRVKPGNEGNARVTLHI